MVCFIKYRQQLKIRKDRYLCFYQIIPWEPSCQILNIQYYLALKKVLHIYLYFVASFVYRRYFGGSSTIIVCLSIGSTSSWIGHRCLSLFQAAKMVLTTDCKHLQNCFSNTFKQSSFGLKCSSSWFEMFQEDNSILKW